MSGQGLEPEAFCQASGPLERPKYVFVVHLLGKKIQYDVLIPPVIPQSLIGKD